MNIDIYYLKPTENNVINSEILSAINYLSDKGLTVCNIKSVKLNDLKDIKCDNLCVILCDNNYFNVAVNTLKQTENTYIPVISLDKNLYRNIDDKILANIEKFDEESFSLYGVDIEIIKKFFADKSVLCAVAETNGTVYLDINKNGLSLEDFDILMKEFLKEFETFIYAEEKITLANYLVKILKLRNLKISCAESFTGGNVSGAITSVSGSSAVFYEGAVTYDSNAKISRLNVSKDVLFQFKPVSPNVAYEMCDGLLNSGKCDIAISTTGIAGPNSDDSDFPVGLCYIAVGTKDKISVYKFNFEGVRKSIINKGVNTALFLTVKALKKL